MWKAQEWGGTYQRYKNKSHEWVSQDKESLERNNDSLQDKRSVDSLHSSRKFRAGSMYIELQKNMLVDKNLSNADFRGLRRIDHFRVPQGLCIKTRLGAPPLIWKWVFILIQIKLISTRKVEHLTSFWYRGPGKLGNGLVESFRLHCTALWICHWDNLAS